MNIKLVSAIVAVLLGGCLSKDTKNPSKPIDSGRIGSISGGTLEALPTADSGFEVVPVERLPSRIKPCVQAGVVGEVVDKVFQCTQQALMPCDKLTETQKTLAMEYGASNLPKYSVWACSQTSPTNVFVHYFMYKESATNIFRLEIQ